MTGNLFSPANAVRRAASGRQAAPHAGAPRHADASANTRGICRSTSHSRRRQTSLARHQSRPTQLHHSLRPAGHWKNLPGTGHRQRHQEQIRTAQRRRVKCCRHPPRDRHCRQSTGQCRPEDHPIHRRNSSIQQSAAGCIAARRGKRHRAAHRRDHAQSILLCQLAARFAFADFPTQGADARRHQGLDEARSRRQGARAGFDEDQGRR